MIPRATLVLAGALAAASFVREAGAAAPAPAVAPGTSVVADATATTVVALGSLPQGTVLDVDWARQPRAIAATRKLAGVKLERMVQKYEGNRQVFVHIGRPDPKKGEAPAHREDDGDDATDDADARLHPSGLCFAAARERDETGRRGGQGRGAATDDESSWEANGLSEQTTIAMPSGAGTVPGDRVQQVHIEQLVVTTGGPALDSRDAWIDSSTGGARVRATAHLPLRDLGATPEGLHLFAGRHGEEVVFVAQTAATTQSLFASRNGVGVTGTSCDHLVIRLPLRRGLSQFAALHSLVRMRSPREKEETDDGKASASAAKVGAAGASNGDGNAPPAGRAHVGPTFFHRAGQLVMSEVWEPNDPAPQISFSYGWNGREQLE